MAVSLVTCDLGVVLEIAGGLSATALAFIVSFIEGPFKLESCGRAPSLSLHRVISSPFSDSADNPAAVPCCRVLRPHPRSVAFEAEATCSPLCVIRDYRTGSELRSDDSSCLE